VLRSTNKPTNKGTFRFRPPTTGIGSVAPILVVLSDTKREFTAVFLKQFLAFPNIQLF
jgi:hypothetical protein